MFQLIESIRLENGRFLRLHYHQARVNQAFANLFKDSPVITLHDFLLQQKYSKTGVYKCRVVYSDRVLQVEFIPYEPKPVKSLKIVYDSEISYPYKYGNREAINRLFNQRQFCDDILIVKNGFVTDSSYSNIIFFDGDRWVTPHTPLLNGTMRQFLLDAAEIKATPITVQDIPAFKSFRLINAMLGFDGPEIEVSGIVF
jgi:4-amino-4-deoxychorismate lyase